MALGWYVQKNNVTVKEDRGSYWQKKSPSAAADRTAPTDRGSAAVRWGKFCVYGSSWDIWHDIHKYTVYIEVKRRQREKREKQSEEKAGQREMSVLSGQRKPVLSEREESICVCVCVCWVWGGGGSGLRWLHWGSAFRMAFTSSATAVSANSNCSWGGGGGRRMRRRGRRKGRREGKGRIKVLLCDQVEWHFRMTGSSRPCPWCAWPQSRGEGEPLSELST